jgi:hypothetical protein
MRGPWSLEGCYIGWLGTKSAKCLTVLQYTVNRGQEQTLYLNTVLQIATGHKKKPGREFFRAF